MRIVDPTTGRTYVEKRRVRYDEPGQPRKLTFSCYRRCPFLARDRTRPWFCEALGPNEGALMAVGHVFNVPELAGTFKMCLHNRS
jgi:hypothetical protein